ncbi:BPSL0067 family protein [Paraburkholderia sp. CHISQ3]
MVMDQWTGDTTKPTISSRRICPKGKLENGTYVDPSNNADAYFIVE